MRRVSSAARRWRGSALRVLGGCMVGLGVLIGLIFPYFLEALNIATASAAHSIAARSACIAAGLALGGANYLLARLVIGGRQRRLTAHLRKVDDIVRSATLTGDWSALIIKDCQIPIDSTDAFGETAHAFNALVNALDQSVAERRRLEAQLHHQAFHDPLTGLANRALFLDRLNHRMAQLPREHSGLAVLYVDLDGFKTVNDTLGHAAGDEVLVEISRRLQVGRRLTDTVARLGGDEFAILLEDTNLEEAARVVADLRASLSASTTLANHVLPLAASIGLAVADARIRDPETLLAEADAAMYRAKNASRISGAITRDIHAAPPLRQRSL